MNKNTRYLTVNGILVAFAIAIQLIGRNLPTLSQGFVGPTINAILILSVLMTNLKYASMLAILTPITALLTAQLNPAMGFFVPFICVCNLVFVVLFSLCRLKSVVKVNDKIANIVSLVIASVGKFIFLSFAATKIIVWLNLGVAPKILEKLAVAMGVAQLYAALAGGILAIVLGGVLLRINAKSNK